MYSLIHFLSIEIVFSGMKIEPDHEFQNLGSQKLFSVKKFLRLVDFVWLKQFWDPKFKS